MRTWARRAPLLSRPKASQANSHELHIVLSSILVSSPSSHDAAPWLELARSADLDVRAFGRSDGRRRAAAGRAFPDHAGWKVGSRCHGRPLGISRNENSWLFEPGQLDLRRFN